MAMTRLFYLTEAVLTQGIGRLSLGDTSMLDEPPSSLLLGAAC